MRSAGRRGGKKPNAGRKVRIRHPGRRAYDGMLKHYETRSENLEYEARHNGAPHDAEYERGKAYAYRHAREMHRGRRL